MKLFHIRGINFIQIYILMKILNVKKKTGELPTLKILENGSYNGNRGWRWREK